MKMIVWLTVAFFVVATVVFAIGAFTGHLVIAQTQNLVFALLLYARCQEIRASRL